MKLHLLEALINRFLENQLLKNDPSWIFPHSLVAHFHKMWTPGDVLPLVERLEIVMQSQISQRWWKRDNYRPKELILRLVKMDEELAVIAFKDLANDAASLEGRISRFQFYMEELLQMMRRNNTRDIETDHYQDASMISLYIAGWFPEKYSLYPGLQSFASFCRQVGSPDIPVVDDLPRYEKVANIIYKYLQQNNAFETLINQRGSEFPKDKVIPFQVTYEIVKSHDL